MKRPAAEGLSPCGCPAVGPICALGQAVVAKVRLTNAMMPRRRAALLLGNSELESRYPLAFSIDVIHYNCLQVFDVELNYDELDIYLVEPGMNDFVRLLEAEIPRLRRYARALTRDVVRADDLVQNGLTRAIAKQHLWQHGTDLRSCTISMSTKCAVRYVKAPM
jgi:Sigma-70 region 2